MSAALILALVNASPAVIGAVMKVIADIRASGHPDTAKYTPAHEAAISAALSVDAAQPIPAALADPDGPA